MCCRIDLNPSSEAARFLGKTEPNLLPKTNDNIATKDTIYTGSAESLFERIVSHWRKTRFLRQNS